MSPARILFLYRQLSCQSAKRSTSASGHAGQQVRIAAVEDAARHITADVQAVNLTAVIADGVHGLVDADAIHGANQIATRSPYSRPNIERPIWLEAHGLIHPRVRESVLPIIQAPFVFPVDIMESLRQDETVCNYYQQFSDSYRRIRVAYIDAARKRPEEFQKRLNSFIDKTRRNKLITGYGGIDKYYR